LGNDQREDVVNDEGALSDGFARDRLLRGLHECSVSERERIRKYLDPSKLSSVVNSQNEPRENKCKEDDEAEQE
jgi:hypothetical protein